MQHEDAITDDHRADPERGLSEVQPQALDDIERRILGLTPAECDDDDDFSRRVLGLPPLDYCYEDNCYDDAPSYPAYPKGRKGKSARDCLVGPPEQRRQSLKALILDCEDHEDGAPPWWNPSYSRALREEAEQLLAEIPA